MEEFVISKYKFRKFLALLAGIGFVYLLTELTPEHSH